MPASFIVRDIEPNDRPRWEPLWQDYQTSRKVPEEITETTWRRFFDGLEPVYALVAEEREAVIGFVHYLLHRSTAMVGPTCYLQDMFTMETERGRGVGRAMIDAVCARAKAAGASRVYSKSVRSMPQHGRSTTRSRRSQLLCNIVRTYELCRRGACANTATLAQSLNGIVPGG